jgi:uncharacterized damage-inducible protein DinB
MMRGVLIGFMLTMMAWPLGAQDLAAYKQEYLWELDYASKQVNALAGAVPAEKYGWRPAEGVRSVSEVYMHIVAGNFLLLDIAGHAAPEDVYGKVAGSGRARAMALVKLNAAMEKTITEKPRVEALLKRSLEAVRAAIEGARAAELDRHVDFFGMDKTVRGIYLRILTHVNEHMGQSVAYARVNGIVPPWSQAAPKPK